MRRSTSSHYLCTVLLLLFAGVLALSAPADAAMGTTVIPGGGADVDSSGTYSGRTAGKRLLAAGTPYATPYYDLDSGRPGPTVLIVGGVHGNETAGYLAAHRLASIRPRRGRVLVIPEANRLGVQAGSRTGAHPGDLNRDFPRSDSDDPDSVLARSIWSLMERVGPDYVFDLHEGYDFHRQNSESVGQSLIYYPIDDAYSLAKEMQSAVNDTISIRGHHFSLLRYPIRGSLARAAGIVLDSKAMILETSRKQALETRVDQHVTMVRAALRSLGMI